MPRPQRLQRQPVNYTKGNNLKKAATDPKNAAELGVDKNYVPNVNSPAKQPPPSQQTKGKKQVDLFGKFISAEEQGKIDSHQQRNPTESPESQKRQRNPKQKGKHQQSKLKIKRNLNPA